MEKYYITFTVFDTDVEKRKLAVECDMLSDALDVGSDVYSFDGVCRVRIRKCDKPTNRVVISEKEYWNYSWLQKKQ